ncbi:Serine-aspartate repeat-containing protein F precursor [Planctomycetes bacterium CA13]|uniref:Serine-aspartate repeat-containing protein F n=1 Tax=Novipirellula herctigrandis TaxID=2527986 RepID=A0A5C5Z7L8_9BACT|nr:Serine-aspartate repeat-containing protein F precursor [Planctomycetes bacterium CA13]
MRHLRHLLGRPVSPKSDNRRTDKLSHGGKKRRLISEMLERRELLAGDVMANSYHNDSLAYDVDANQQITALDALMVINHLSQRDSGQGELGEVTGFVDVNNDGDVTASDALMVINELNRIGEGADEAVIELQLSPRTPVGNVSQDLPGATGVYDVSVGQVFELEVSYLDLRGDGLNEDDVPDRRGVFQLVTDIFASGVANANSTVVPIVHEAQQLLVDGEVRDGDPAGDVSFDITLRDAEGNTLNQKDEFGDDILDGSLNPIPISVNVTADDFIADPVTAVRTALLALDSGDGTMVFSGDDFVIEELDAGKTAGGVTTDYLLQVRFRGDGLIGQDAPNIIMSPMVSIAGRLFPLNTFNAVTREYSVTNGLPDPPDDIQYALDFSSASLNGREFFSNTGAVGEYDPTGLALFNDLRGLGSTQIVPSSPGANNDTLANPFDSYSVPVFIQTPVTGLELRVDMSEVAEAILVYGTLDPASATGEIAATVNFGTDTDAITATAATTDVAFDGVQITFTGSATGPATPLAVYTSATKTIEVSFDSDTATYTQIAAAIDALPDFDSSVSTGDGTALFVAPTTTPVLDNEPKSIVTRDRLQIDEDASFTINATQFNVAQPGSFAITASVGTVNEGDPAAFVITRTDGSEGSVTVNYNTVDGTAVAPGDYTAVTAGSVTFAAGETTKTITITTIDDAVEETAENFSVTLSSVSAGEIGMATAQVTIPANDTVTPQPGAFSITADSASVDEGSTAAFTITRANGTDGEVTVTFSTVDGTAVAPGDYTAINTGTVVFADGETTKTVNVTTINDTVEEGAETFSVTISDVTSGTIATTTAQVTIPANDVVVVQPGTFSIAADNASVDEGSPASFTITRAGGSDGIVTVSYNTVDGTAVAPGDYTAVPAGSVTFAAGETTKTISVTTINDTIEEVAENFSVTLSDVTAGTIGTATAQVTMPANDTVVAQPGTFSIAADNASVNEGSPATFTITRANGSDGSVTVSYDTVDGTAVAPGDYTAVAAGSVVFAAGETTKTISVTTIDDTAEEVAENFSVTLSNVTAGTIGTATAQVTIPANDTVVVQPGTFSIAADNATVSEGSDATFTITRSGGSDGSVTVSYNTVNGTAVAPGDYTAVAAGSVVFAAGETTKTISVTTIDDTAEEAAENFSVTLSEVSAGTIGTDTAQVTIPANDIPVAQPGTFSVSANNATVNEGGTATFTITRTGGSDGEVTVSFNTVNGTAFAPGDYTAIPAGSIVFNDGELTKTFTVTTIDDVIEEAAENFSVQLTDVSGGAIGTASAQVTIPANDTPTGPGATVSGAIFIDKVENIQEVAASLGAVAPIRDGIKDSSEAGLTGVSVELRLPTGELVKEVRTDNDGAYEFNEVQPGSYVLHFGVSEDNVFLSGSNEVPINVGASDASVPGSLAVLGTSGALGSVDILGSTYLRNNEALLESSNGGRRGGSVSLDSEGHQIFMMAAEGFDSVEYIEVMLNDTRDKAIMMIVDDGEVLSTVLTDEEFVVSRDGSALQFFGGYTGNDDFGFTNIGDQGDALGFTNAEIEEMFARSNHFTN